MSPSSSLADLPDGNALIDRPSLDEELDEDDLDGLKDSGESSQYPT